MTPAMSLAEVACYERHLVGAKAVLEYGTGGSTVLAGKAGVASLYSVESDVTWLESVRADPAVAELIAAGRAKLVLVDLGRIGRWGKPKNKMWMPWWPGYARRPWQDGFKPDLVLVDGRFRVSCIMQALLNGGPGTKIVVHDFWRRHYYHAVLEFAAPIDRADSMVVLQSKGQKADFRSRWIAWRYLYDHR